MVKTDAIAGIVNEQFRFHYDIAADVLYLRLLGAEDISTYGDLTDEGDILLRDEQSDRAVGLTIVSWWKRYGAGVLPDSIREIQKHIEPLTTQMVA